MERSEQRAERGGIEMVSFDKNTSATIELGKKGPEVKISPSNREHSESGVSAEVLGHIYELSLGSNIIGRSENCNITVNVPTVSREHVSINVGDKEYSVTDLGSTNGTYFSEL